MESPHLPTSNDAGELARTTSPGVDDTPDVLRDDETLAGRLAATVERLRRQLRDAETAADARSLIELAKGIVMERLQCGPAQAARQLRELATTAQLPLLELAADIVNQTAGDPLAFAISGDAPPPPRGSSSPSPAVRLRTAESGILAAGETQAAAASLLDHALAPLGASALAVWACAPDGSLTLAGHAGFTSAEAVRWRYVPPGVGTLAQRVLRLRRPLWDPSSVESSAPSIGGRDLTGDRVVLPAETNGRLLGVLEICWPGPLEPLPPAVQRQLEALAELCARTLDDNAGEAVGTGEIEPVSPLTDLADSLLDPALVLHPWRDGEGRVTDFLIAYTNEHFADLAGRPRADVTGRLLLEVYPLAALEGGLFDKVEHVHATGEPFHSERMILSSLVDQVPISSVAAVGIGRYGDAVLLTWRVQDEAARLAALLQHAQRLGRIGGFEENTATGEITWNSQLFALYGLPPTAAPIPLEQLRSHSHPDDAVAIGRFLRTVLHHRRPASTAFRLQRPDGVVRHIRVVAEPVTDAGGHLVAVRGAYQDVSAQHWTEVALAATRDRLADTEQRAAERNRLALQLQQAIMPPAPPPMDVSGLRVAVRYRPAEKEHLVGGDWYDAVALPTGQVLLAVGDVAGHGIEAATGMVVLRNALRGLAATGAGPAQLLGWLNTVAFHLTEQVTATAVCGVYDPPTGVLRWSRAGHLPPVLLREESAEPLPLPGGILLGAVPDASYDEEELELRPGDTLLMYTDGLIERRDRSLQHSLDRLLTLARRPVEGGLEEQLDHLLTHGNADTDDDTCLIGVRLN
ncbi:SpoIIE family protein phosphatase [Marinactinospora thermotolerans]|uniref:Serine phosphatase RsbU, regulator of sigma subunit n=1 Tax=Marinactinospora thermotolerans DSM 45154 TaxID=1122192 RepID=A0A1T4JYL8_9ACTN|nr:SpoIIE family protein phosphatase [Marinactinospora thermotolerans]SJZ35125.1 Serine phosphatase RsbU, regulator of sigma subunit [Marinactinospora thermotolerans DSM 45154]